MLPAAWRTLLAELFAPLLFTAYVAWATVWIAVVGRYADSDPTRAWAMRAALLLFLAGFIAGTVFGSRLDARRFAASCALMAASAFAVLGNGASGAAPILLVLLAAVLAARSSTRTLVLCLVAINACVFALMLWHWQQPWRSSLFALAAFGSFQVFAALVMRYAVSNETLATELRALNADLLATRSLLEESARGEERLKLSRELHDVAGHSLTALKLNLGALLRDPRQPDPDRLRLCAGLADELLQSLRAVVQQMRLHEGVDLRLALQRIAAPFPRPRVHLDLDEDLRVDGVERAEALLRTVQEGLTNAVRHAGAQNVWVALRREADLLHLQLHDDGRVQWPLAPGNGLTGMRERLCALGGELRLARGDAGGLTLEARLPVAERAA